MKNSIDVIHVTKNDPDGILKTIKSFHLKNKYFKLFKIKETVVDGSDDETSIKIREICVKYNVRYIKQMGKGISDAFNVGVMASREEWSWFVNGGDLLYRDIDVNLFERNLRLVKSDYAIFKTLVDGRENEFPEINKMWPPIINWICHPSMLVKTAVLKENIFDEHYSIAMDGDLWIRLLPNTKGYILPQIIAEFNTGGLSSNQKKLARENVKIIIRHLFNISKINFINLIENIKFFVASLICSTKRRQSC